MQKFENNIQDQFGNALTGATITVRHVVGGALASIFSDDGVTALGNPFTAQDGSEFFFYAGNDRYDIFITGPVIDSMLDVVLFDSSGVGTGTNLILAEKAAAVAFVAGFGEFWVRDDAPNVPMFTDDVGTDFVLSTVGGGFNPADNQTITGDWEFQGQLRVENPTDDLELGSNVSIQWRNPADNSTTFLQSLAGRMSYGISGTGFGLDYFDFGNSFSSYRFNNEIRMLDNRGIEFGTGFDYTILFDGTDIVWSGIPNSIVRLVNFDQFRIGMPLGVNEMATPDGDVAGVGQFWVQSEAPNVPMYTSDTGVDILIDPGISDLNEQNGNYTFVFADKGRTVRKASGGAGETYTIPANGTTGFRIGTLIGIENDGGGALSLAITTDTLINGDDNTTGTITIGDGGSVVIKKIAATTWKANGSQMS